MKKMVVLLAAFVLLFSGHAFGFTKADDDKQITCGTGGPTVPLSPRVEALYLGTATTYAVATRNVQGTRTFGTAHNETGIFWAEGISDDVKPTLNTEFSSDATWNQL
ncbi:hypothetical protein SAMN05660860_00658 [Geoalkalibacter ferrihydriticus]|uniref:Uncharacterized protein n=2 Tax=Geoalkalibacter ferrihydriticus TaxID=392333 RepID=A0A0C2DTY1_9BACT|nr:hypothetical protein [Geoalkalibacter ferrihydriticus]KIH76909.1 hypothetical protein GFER_07405 [Geoalkalibacter ferrihydriticus DSM 17813]SDL44917.1 hypothetical protein SAMN05660860_00658 [Geoalkalibacter ferrihydriticus]